MIRLDDLAEDSNINRDHELDLLDQKITTNRDQVLNIESYFESRKPLNKQDDEDRWLQVEDQISHASNLHPVYKTSIFTN